ncbi:hypothetical protein OUZ56_017217 [Daphnia magna]|uniref:Uncharacterized protein n=1 Tax=Daphnia magna TaxID=35525 RepID=A0ABR0ASH6_9CRUS|nr:hypothetical protein OUZ56_017217 [Daphnia magna]
MRSFVSQVTACKWINCFKTNPVHHPKEGGFKPFTNTMYSLVAYHAPSLVGVAVKLIVSQTEE